MAIQPGEDITWLSFMLSNKGNLDSEYRNEVLYKMRGK